MNRFFLIFFWNSYLKLGAVQKIQYDAHFESQDLPQFNEEEKKQLELENQNLYRELDSLVDKTKYI